MAGVYAAIAGVLLSVIALTLFREGRRSGWFAVLFVTLVGGGLELTMNGPTGYLYHHIGLYGYVVAWLAALGVAYEPTFSSPRSTTRRETSATDMEHLRSQRSQPESTGCTRSAREDGGTSQEPCRGLRPVADRSAW